MRTSLCLAVAILLLNCSLPAQRASLPAGYSVVKAENDLVIGWKLESKDARASQIDVYDNDGKLLVGIAPLKFIREAQTSTIYDVSGLPGRFIAVSAVCRKGDDTVPAASLLYFDFRGGLLLALALDPSREIMRLTVDAESNVWTLTGSAGTAKPTEASMIVGYRPSGEVFKELFKRSEFPLHALLTQENSEVGVPGFGHTSDRIWFWLPGSTDLVTFKLDGSSIEKLTTGLPGLSPREAPTKVLLTDNGTLIEQIMGRQDNHQKGRFDLFSRSAKTRHWEVFSSSCGDCLLVGTGRGSALFSKSVDSGLEIDASNMP